MRLTQNTQNKRVHTINILVFTAEKYRCLRKEKSVVFTLKTDTCFQKENTRGCTKKMPCKFKLKL